MQNRVLAGFIGLALLIAHPGHAQKEGAVWYFGQHAGLDFNQQYPRPLTNGQINSPAGVATFSNAAGSLLFYTDGTTVFGPNHLILPNGSALNGNNTVSQSSLIVPWPGNAGKFFLFTAGKTGNLTNPGKGLYYSIVDANLNQVDPASRNVLLQESCAEKITAIRHANNRDWWILAHAINTSEFYVYLLSDNLIPQDNQVIGLKHMVDGNNPNDRGASGYLKASPDGSFVALAIEGFRFFEVFRFDKATGTLLQKPLPISLAADSAYGVEFSPNSKFLYGTSRSSGILYRWDLQTFTEEAVKQSEEILYGNPAYQLGALQLAPNNKIYVAIHNQPHLAVINAPDFSNCQFSIRGASLVDLQSGHRGISGYGLPNIPAVYQKKEIAFANTCLNDTTLIYLPYPEVFDVLREWVINGTVFTADPGLTAIKHVFPQPGSFLIEAKGLVGGSQKTISETIRIHPRPILQVDDTTYLCSGQPVEMHNGQFAFYGLIDAADVYRDSVKSISEDGFYRITVTNHQGCATTIATRAIASPSPEIDTILVTPALCTGAQNGTIQIQMHGNLSDYQFKWTDIQENVNVRNNLPAGRYPVTITLNGGCSLDTTITVETSKLNVRVVRIPGDPSPVCAGSGITLIASGADTYEWAHAPGVFQSSVTVYPDADSTFYVTGSTGGQCFGTDSIRIAVFEKHPLNLGPDRTSCPGVPVVLRAKDYDPGSLFVEWNWSTGEKTDSVVIRNSISNLTLYAKDRNGCWSHDAISISFTTVIRVRLTSSIPLDQPVCQGTEITLTATGADSYLWDHDPSFLGAMIVITPDRDTLIRVSGPREGGCGGSDSIRIQVFEKQVLELGPDRTACAGDTINILSDEYDPDGIFTDWSWSNGVTTASLTATESWNGLELNVKDLNGCPYSDRINLVFHPQPAIVGITKKDISCNGSSDGQVDLTISGTTSGLSYSIDGGTSWVPNGIFQNLFAGNYAVQVRNGSTGCMAQSDSVTIREPDPLNLAITSVSPSCANCTDGEIRVTVTGGTPPYTFNWSGLSDTDSLLVNLGASTYSLTVTDKNRCSAGTDYLLTASELFIPNAFSPNGGGKNETWMIRVLENRSNCLVQVYDRSGQLVYHTDDRYQPWDGTYMNEGKALPAGTYFYLVRIDRNDENKPPQRGTVTLLR